MARYRPYDVHQDKFIPISFRDQILPGSFEHALNQSVDRHIDLTPFAARYTNDETGRLAYEWSGTLKELRHKQKKLDTAARHIVARHRAQDAQEKPSPVVAQEEKKRATYARKRARIKGFLNTAKPNLGHSGNERQSNITDPDSAKMPTHHGVIQGYNGIAVVDAKHPIVATAEARGEGQEAHLLAPMIETTRAQCKAAGIAGENPKRYTSKDFDYDGVNRTCRCPAGNHLYRNGHHINVNGYLGVKFRGAKSVCGPCTQRHRRLSTPDKTVTKQVTIFLDITEARKEKPIEKMKRKFDTVMGRYVYHQRIAIVEPVFANLQNKGMRRFTLRGKDKVDAQWKLFTLVHNIEKIAHCGAS